jgi:thiamine biosynthesis protein ThiI
MGKTVLLIKPFSEIYLKSHFVKQFFLRKLISNLRNALKKNGLKLKLLHKFPGLIICQTNDNQKALPLIKKIFGIHCFSVAVASSFSSLDDLKEIFLDFAKRNLSEGDSFALRVSRNGKHSFSSRDVAVECGQKIMDSINGLKVDLSAPKKEIFADIIQKNVFLYSRKLNGLKGLPVGVEGKVGLLMEGKKEELLSGFLMLRRGCNIFPVVKEMNHEIKRNLELLSKFNSFNEFKPIPFTQIKKQKNFLSALILTELNENKAINKMQELSRKTGFVVFSPLTFYPKQKLNEIFLEVKK